MRSPVAYVDDEGLRAYRSAVDVRPPTVRLFGVWSVIVAFVLGFLFGAATSAESSCVRLQVRPVVMLHSGTITVEARIAKHADHRWYRLDWDSDTGSAGSSGPLQLAGDQAAPLINLTLLDQPPAHYEFVARVFDSVGHVLGSDRAVIRSQDGP